MSRSGHILHDDLLRVDPMWLVTLLAGFDLMKCPHTNSLHGTEEHNTGQTDAHSESPKEIMSLTRRSYQYVATSGGFHIRFQDISRGSSTRPLSEIEAMWTLRCRHGRMCLGLAESRGVSGLNCPLLGVPLVLLLATTWYGHGKNLQKLS